MAMQSFPKNNLLTFSAVFLIVFNCLASQAQYVKDLPILPGYKTTVRKKNIDKPAPQLKIVKSGTRTIGYYQNGSKALEIDTVTGYHKYWYPNGQLQMEGKVTKGKLKDYRDSIWKYYSDSGFLGRQETYNVNGKLNSTEFQYFSNKKVLSETYKYFEGDYQDKANFKFYIIEKEFYTNGQLLTERTTINGTIIEVKCWNSKGVQQPIAFLKTLKSLDAE